MAANNQNVYFLNRDWQSSARLHFQHFICQSRMGYLIHPTIEASIKKKTPQPRILELGTGTGIWAIEAARKYPHATITALDISDNQFPPAGTLPNNITFFKYNFFEPVPSELAGLFDVVHIAFITGALFKGGRDTVIEHVKQFLKPGGWIQWREILTDINLVIDPQNLENGAAELQVMNYVEKHVGYMSAQKWVSDMPKVLTDVGGFVDTDSHIPGLEPSLLNMETQLLLWNCHEMLATFPKLIGTKEAETGAEESMKDIEAIVASGKMLHWRFLIGIGRKPE